MTAAAKITQLDMERAAKAVAKAGVAVGRIVMDFANQRIEIILGEPMPADAPLETEEWNDDDV